MVYRFLVALVVFALVGCAPAVAPPQSSGSSPTAERTEPRQVADDLASELSQANVSATAGAAAQQDLETILRGMDGLVPAVIVDSVTPTDSGWTTTLKVTWPLPSGPWSYTSTATLADDDTGATLEWDTSILHPDLTPDTRLVHQTSYPKRADILAEDGSPLMTYRRVFRVGINKPDADEAQWAQSAVSLAGLLDIDPERFEAKVEAAGPAAFVEALVLRDTGDAPPNVGSIPGAVALSDSAVLSPARGFAEGLLGTVGPAMAEQITESDGKLTPGVLAGRSGLQQRFDDQLRGTPGGSVLLRARTESGPADKVIHRVDPVPGVPLRTSLSLDLQRHAEESLKDAPTAAALVAINPETGYVRAAATGPANRSAADATIGRYPPGSVFKAITVLALLRSGMTPDSMTNCTETVVVDGRRFRNYRDFPSDRLGRMTLRDAMATSCNTALIAEWERLDGAAIREAAASLGLGQDFDAGFPAFMGSTPDPANTVGLAESIIGQGLIEASPLAMAVVTASIQAGKTVHPVLLPDLASDAASGRPLTSTEAAQLQEMLEETVSSGTGQALAGVAIGAKTGTAQYGSDDPLPTHAWMIAYDESLAVAAIVTDGDSGSKTVAPILRTFFS